MSVRYWPGMNEAIEKVRRMSRSELLIHIDILYGRDNLKFEATDDDIREEAIRQTMQDFTRPAGV